MSMRKHKSKRSKRQRPQGARTPKGQIRYPLATVIPYGPDDQTVTKLVVAILKRPDRDPGALEQWVGTDIAYIAKTEAEIRAFMNQNKVKTVVAATAVLGCPHEEGEDFPEGEDCPFCPFWRGKQGSGTEDERWDNLKTIAVGKWTGLGTFRRDGANESPSDVIAAKADAQFKRIETIVPLDPDLDRDQAVAAFYEHLKANLRLPCEVTGLEDFKWEEVYVFGVGDPAEYEELTKTQPSYTDLYELLEIDRTLVSQWMLFRAEDIAARVRRKKDSREFILGLAELQATDPGSQNYQLLDDYAVWFINSR